MNKLCTSTHLKLGQFSLKWVDCPKQDKSARLNGNEDPARMALFATEDIKKIDHLYQEGQWAKIIQSHGKKPLSEYDDICLLNDGCIGVNTESRGI